MTLLHGRVRYLAFLVVVAAGVATIVLGSTMRVRRTEVYGTLLLDHSAVVDAAGLNGTNPFTVNTASAVKRVLALGVPESVWISFVLPDTAVVTVVERSPAYIWKVDSTMYLVSSDGTVLGTTTRENERVIVVDSARRPVKIGQNIDVRPLREAAYLMSLLPRLTNLDLHYVLYSPEQGIVVPTPSGANVAFGDDQDLNLKVEDLGPTLKVANSQKPPATLIDLQSPRHPYFR